MRKRSLFSIRVSPDPQCLVLRFALFTAASRNTNRFETGLKGSLRPFLAEMPRGGMLRLELEVEDRYIGGQFDWMGTVGIVFHWPGDSSVLVDQSMRPYSCTRRMRFR